VALLELLVEVLDGEALIVLLVQRAHALELVLGRAPGRRPPDPAIDQAFHPLLLGRRKVRSLIPSAAAASSWLKLPPSNRSSSSSKRMIPILASLSTRPPVPAPLERFQNRTDHALPKPANSRAPYKARAGAWFVKDPRDTLRDRFKRAGDQAWRSPGPSWAGGSIRRSGASRPTW
jgi:hypothetical protein